MSIRNRIEFKRIVDREELIVVIKLVIKNKKNEFSEQIENDAGIKKHQRRNGDL